MSESLIEAGIEALANGLCPVPTRRGGGKAPHGRWKRWQSERPTEDELRAAVADGGDGIGIVCGAVSSNVVCLDFDVSTALGEWAQRCADVGLEDLCEHVCAGYLESTPKGAHVLVRCPAGVGGNEKLAPGIETRGEGGYVVIAPSGGSVHETGQPYTLERGGLDSIAEVSADELKLLLDVARSFASPVDSTDEPPSWSTEGTGGRPGDEWAAQTSWASILEPHGWKRVYQSGGTAYWRRPGKDRGISASTNHAGSDLLYVFTTSTAFESGRGYGKFGAWALLDHDSDYSAASRELARRGFGDPPPESPGKADISGIISGFGKRRETVEALIGKIDDPPPDLAMSPVGAIGEIAKWINETSVSPQPELAVAASIACVSTIVGRVAIGPTGLRTNLYIIGVAPSCSGKAHAPRCVSRVLSALGQPDRILNGRITSGKAVYDQLRWHSSSLWMVDEFGIVLGRALNARGGTERELKECLLELVDAPQGEWGFKTYAVSKDVDQDAQRLSVVQPCMSVYATTTGSTLWAAMSGQGAVASGLLGRFLIVESRHSIPTIREAEQAPPPASVVSRLGRWLPDAKASLMEASQPTGDSAPKVTYHVPASASAGAALSRWQHDIVRVRQAINEADETSSTALGRLGAHTWRLALAHACGRAREPESARIEQVDAEWAIAFASWASRGLLRAVRDDVSESAAERTKQAVLRALRALGGTASMSAVTRKTRGLERRERREAVDDLIEAGEIIATKNGRKTIAHLPCDAPKCRFCRR